MQKNTKKIKYKNTLLAKCSIIFLKGDALSFYCFDIWRSLARQKHIAYNLS